MSVLYGLSLVVMPIGEFAGGQIYQVGGYGTVYIVSTFICICGLIYVLFIVPDEQVTTIQKPDEEDVVKIKGEPKKEISKKELQNTNIVDTMRHVFQQGNKAILESYR